MIYYVYTVLIISMQIVQNLTQLFHFTIKYEVFDNNTINHKIAVARVEQTGYIYIYNGKKVLL